MRVCSPAVDWAVVTEHSHVCACGSWVLQMGSLHLLSSSTLHLLL